MLNKKIFLILTIFIVSLGVVSAVSATDNATVDVVSVEETTADVVSVEETTADVVSVEETTADAISVDEAEVVSSEDNKVIIRNESDVGTFDELNGMIENTPTGSVLNLSKDYKYVEGSTNIIRIDNAITIDGKGHILDGNQLSMQFVVWSDVLLKNIIFKNFKSDISLFSWNGHNGKVLNCTFTDCQCYNKNSRRGTIFDWSGEGIIDNCRFINNSISSRDKYSLTYGGVIYVGGSVSICNSLFLNNSALSTGYGGAISVQTSGNVKIYNNTFINNSAGNGGAIFLIRSDNINISNCIFIDNRMCDGNNSININTECYDGVIMSNSFLPDDENQILNWGGVNFYIPKLKSYLIINNLSCYYMNLDSSYNISLVDNNGIGLINKSINFCLSKGNISDSFSLTTDSQGIINLYNQLCNLDVGIWELICTFGGTGNYEQCNVTSIIKVNKADSFLSINDINGVVNHESTLVAIVTSNNLMINEGIVTFYDGENNIGQTKCENGVASLTYTPISAGEHKITAVYNANNYLNSNNTANLLVAKSNVTLNIQSIATVYFTTPSTITININSNNKEVNEGEVRFYINNIFIGTADVHSGIANINYVANTTGSFTLNVFYNETKNYFSSNSSSSFQVNKMPTTLTGDTTFFDEEQTKIFTTELKDYNVNGVSGQIVRIEAIKYSGESKTFTGISNETGITIYDVGDLSGGMWIVRGIYDGDNNYIGSGFSDKFIVIRMNTTTTIEEFNTPQINHNYKLKANIHDEDGKLVKEGIVQFYLDGVNIGSIDLSKNNGHQNALGKDVLGAVNPLFEDVLGAVNPLFEDVLSADNFDVYFNYIPTKAGQHNLTAVYEGTSLYRPSNSTTILDVSDSSTIETVITAPTITTVYNGGKYLVATLKDVKGKVVSGVKVTFVINGKTSTSTTNSYGQAKVSTNGLVPVKTYKVSITFKGNTKYDKSTATTNVKVTKASPKLTAKSKTFKLSDKTKIYTVTLKTNQNKVMKSTKITLTVKGKTYSAKTNNKGVATFKLTKLTKKGKFTAVVKYAGSKYYNAKTVKPKITVK